MSDPRSDVIGVESPAAHYNDTRYILFLIPQVFIIIINILGAWSMEVLYSIFMSIVMYKPIKHACMH